MCGRKKGLSSKRRIGGAGIGPCTPNGLLSGRLIRSLLQRYDRFVDIFHAGDVRFQNSLGGFLPNGLVFDFVHSAAHFNQLVISSFLAGDNGLLALGHRVISSLLNQRFLVIRQLVEAGVGVWPSRSM